MATLWAAVGLGVFVFTQHEGFSHADDAQIPVDVLPFEAVNLTRAHACEEARGEVVLVVRPAHSQDALEFRQAERVDVGLAQTQGFDVQRG